MTEPTKPDDPNQSVIEYLHYYCNPDSKFDYAVMLRGKWGAGKTYLIKRFVQEREKKKFAKTLYVSLYGLTSFRQIDEAFFRQLHPILSSKGMKIMAALGRGLLKTAVKVDIDSDGKDDVTISSSLPDVDWGDYFKTPNECLLIFDDLERCSLKVSDTLGYINAFVEQEGFKVIVLANEEEILKRNDNQNDKQDDNQSNRKNNKNNETQYAQIKEKLIGQTLTVRSTIQQALPNFLKLIKNEQARVYLENHLLDISLLHSQSGTENLRLLKRAMWDFERLSTCLTATHWDNGDATGVLFRVILSLSFEVRSGKLSEEQLVRIPQDAGIRLFGKKEGATETPSDVLKNRYPEVEFDQTLINAEVLRALLFDGWIDPESIREMLDQNPYFASPRTLPPWKAAWHGWDLSDAEFERAVKTVEKQFAKREYVIPGEMFHVFGLRLWFSRIGVISKKRSEVVADAKAYIDDLRKEGSFPDPFTERRSEPMNGWDRLGFIEGDTPEFTEIVDYFHSASAEVLEKGLPKKGEELLKPMKEDVQAYFRQLCVNNVTASPFYDIPVLARIDPNMFVDHVLALPPNVQGSVFATFKGRYERGMLERELSDEKVWLIAVKGAFEKKLDSLGLMSRYRIANRAGNCIDIYLKPPHDMSLQQA